MDDPYPQFTKKPADMKAVKPFLGAYAVEGSDQSRVFFVAKGKLFTRRGDGRPMEVFSAGTDRSSTARMCSIGLSLRMPAARE